MSKQPVSVAVIGPQEHTTRILHTARKVPDVTAVAYPYQGELEAGSLFRQAAQQHPVTMFAGPIPYDLALEKVGAQAPMVHVPFTGAALCRALFLFRDRFGADLRVSIDTLGKQDVVQAFEELGRESEDSFSLEYDHTIGRNAFVEFHRELFESNKSTGALTALKSSYDRLLELNIPAVRIEPTQQSIIDTLNHAVLIGKNIEAYRNQLAVGLVRWADSEGQHRVGDALYRLDRFVTKLAGYTLERGPDERLFFTTRGLLEHVTDHFSSFPDMLQYSREGLSLWMGIGFGLTVNQAYQHADIALQKAQQHGKTSCWLVSADKNIVGPLRGKHVSSRRARTVNPRLLGLAESIGISVRSFQLFLGAIGELRHEEFTVNDISPLLATSVRNSRKILNRLNAKGLIEIVGKEPLHDRGKPRTVFRSTDALTTLASETSTQVRPRGRTTGPLGEIERAI